MTVSEETRTCIGHGTMIGTIAGGIEMIVVREETARGTEIVTLIVATMIETAMVIVDTVIVVDTRTGDASAAAVLTGHTGTLIGEGETGTMNGRTTTGAAGRMALAGVAAAGVPARRVLSAG